MEARPDLEALDIEELAERFMAERAKTYEVFKDSCRSSGRARRRGPTARVGPRRVAGGEGALDALDHFATLLDMHLSFETKQARAWQA